MTLIIREACAEDAEEGGRICYEAFAAIANAHNFLPDFPSAEQCTGLFSMLLGAPHVYAVVAEKDGKVVGSNFLAEGGTVSGVGPISVDPQIQNSGIGARLMQAVMDRSRAKAFPGIRLVQAGYHCRSFSLYSKLGFEVREHLTCMTGNPVGKTFAGYNVRPAPEKDIVACNALCLRVHGLDRNGELRASSKQGHARVVERDGRITGYTTNVGFVGHSVAETTDDLKALIASADAFPHPGFIVPSRNGELLRWCFSEGLRMNQPLTLMTIGLYNEPKGAWMPSILY